MKIWIFQTGEYLPIDGNSVRAMRAINLSNYFLEREHQVTLWSAAFNHQKKNHRSRKFKIEKLSKNYQINLIPSPGYRNNISLQRLFDHFILAINTFRYINKTAKDIKPDFVFIGYPPIETSFVLSLWLSLSKIPFCIDVKDQWPHIFLLKTQGIKRNFLKIILFPYYFISLYSLKGADFLTSISPTFLKWVEDFSKNKSPKNQTLYLVPNKLKQKKNISYECRDWWTKKTCINIEKKNKIIFAGNINNSFNFDNLIDSLSHPKIVSLDFELIICGDGDCKKDLEKRFSKFNNVFFPGWVDLDQLNFINKLSIASLAPYENTEDFKMSIPNKIIDSLFLGLPIITGLRGEVERLLYNYKVGYFCKNKQSWIKQIYSCVKNNDLRETYSKNAKELYKERFNTDKVYGNFIRFIEKNYG